MKKMFLFLVVATSIFTTGCVSRQYVSGEIVREPTMDINSDGKISQEEFNQSMERQFGNLVGKADKNGDSRVSINEFIESRKKGSFIVIYRGMDENKDGRIAEKEFDLYNEKLFSHFLRYYAADHQRQLSREDFLLFHNKLFVKIDVNNSGLIDERELFEFKKSAPVPRKVSPHVLFHPFISFSEGHGAAFPVGDPWDGETDTECPDCPHPDYPGCTYGDVMSGNCVEVWQGEWHTPFF